MEGEFFTSITRDGGAQDEMVLWASSSGRGVGVLSEWSSATPRAVQVAIIQPLTQLNVDISESHDAMATADRLELPLGAARTPDRCLIEKRMLGRNEHQYRVRNIRIGYSEASEA